MVNNYYIGDIHHNKTIKKDAYTEKLVYIVMINITI